MPCDSDDESNVVVPRPDSVSQQKNDALENQAPERSPTSVSDKSTLQALSNVREKATSGNGEELSGLPARKVSFDCCQSPTSRLKILCTKPNITTQLRVRF